MTYKTSLAIIALFLMLPCVAGAYSVSVSSEIFDSYQFTSIEMQGNEFSFRRGEGMLSWLSFLFLRKSAKHGQLTAELNARRAEAEDTVPAHFLVLSVTGDEKDLPDFRARYQLIIRLDGQDCDMSSPFNTNSRHQIDEDTYEEELILDIDEDTLKRIAAAKKVRLTLMDRIYTQRRVFNGKLTADNLKRFKDFYETHVQKMRQAE